MKRERVKTGRQGLVSLLGLVLTIAIICILMYTAFKVYFKQPLLNEETSQSLSGQGINTSSYQSILDSSREKVEDINRRLLDRARQLED